MTHKTPRRLTTAALCAKAIRHDLAKAYPGVTFRVRSKNFSMGDDVNVDYIDGPPREKVEKLLAKYQKGHFDGMIDLYEYSNSRDDIPQTKYLFVNRDYSEAAKNKALAKMKAKNSVFTCRGWETFDKLQTWDMFTAINRTLGEVSL